MLRNRIIPFFIFHFLLFIQGVSQNADCDNALRLQDTIYNSGAISGFGNDKEFVGNLLGNKKVFQEERNSSWYIITIPDSGEFTFDILPSSPQDDWDFLLYNNSVNFCKQLLKGKVEPIRSNLSRSAETGMSRNAKSQFVGAGLQSNYSKSLSVKKGEEYILVINNPKQSNRKFQLVLNYPASPKIVTKTDTIIQLESKSDQFIFKIIIKDKLSQKLISSDVTIRGLEKEFVDLKEVTSYEIALRKKKYKAYVNVAAKGYMLNAVELNILGTKDSTVSEVFLDKIETGKKINLKRIQFYGNSPKFLPVAKKSLLSLLSFMQLNEEVKIEIEGHVNGPRQRNSKDYKELSKSRAKAVKAYLVENGINKNRISFVGYGNRKMLFPNARSARETSANRRVEIKIKSK